MSRAYGIIVKAKLTGRGANAVRPLDLMSAPRLSVIPSTVDPPPGSGAGPGWQGGAPYRTNDLAALGQLCSACLGRRRAGLLPSRSRSASAGGKESERGP
jgi:hypothetical protein